MQPQNQIEKRERDVKEGAEKAEAGVFTALQKLQVML